MSLPAKPLVITGCTADHRPPGIAAVEFQRTRKKPVAAVKPVDMDKDRACLSIAAAEHHTVDELGHGDAKRRRHQHVGFQT